ncbi:MAG: phosphate ABC transporter substrate-binding protein [Candidatus Altiarchaeota archaeon]
MLKKIFLYCSLIALIFSLGCVKKESEEVKDKLVIAGSTTVQPIIIKAAEIFSKKYPEIKIGVQGGGSGTGIRMISEGSIDIGASSRELSEEEKRKHPELIAHKIALDCIVIIVHPSNPIENLTLEQVRKIFLGEITNFKEVGGPDKKIVVVQREDGGGTRVSFNELVMNHTEVFVGALQKPSSGAVRFTVSGNENAIGYVGIGYLDGTIKPIAINGVMPTEENIQNGKYPLARNLYLITRGQPTGKVKNFIDFILSDEGQEIVKKEGFVRIKK